jgi:predicted transposase YdaD
MSSTKNYTIFAEDIQSTFLNQKKNMGIEEILIEDAREEGKLEGEIQGIEKGIERGIERGIEKGIVLLVSNVIKKHPKWSDAKIADLLEVNIEIVKSVRAELMNR